MFKSIFFFTLIPGGIEEEKKLSGIFLDLLSVSLWCNFLLSLPWRKQPRYTRHVGQHIFPSRYLIQKFVRGYLKMLFQTQEEVNWARARSDWTILLKTPTQFLVEEAI